MQAPPLFASIWEVKETTWLLLVAVEVVDDAELDDDDKAMINCAYEQQSEKCYR